MKIKEINVYEFDELSEEAKQQAINNWYTNETYPCLEDNLEEFSYPLLEDNKIEIMKNFDILYSLSNCQGDGVCFVGEFKWKKYHISITHNFRYYHNRSTDINITTQFDNEAKEEIYKDFKKIYYSICDKIEKGGYEELEYRMDFKEFEELCQVNEYTFLENGTMENI